MLRDFYAALKRWKNRYDDREKIQHSYLALALVVVVGAGLVSLVDAEFGRSLLVISLGAIIIFGVNAVVWAMLNSWVLSKINGQRKK